MFEPDPRQLPIQFFPHALPPQFRGGVASSRHDVALAEYLEKQEPQRRADAADPAGQKSARPVWDALFQTGRWMFGAVLHPLNGGRLSNEFRNAAHERR